MKKIIRWPGLIAFVVLVGGLAGFWLLFADAIVKGMIERRGTAMVGAKVEIAGLDLSLMPAGMKIRGLAVTDPDNPMTNAVEIGEMVMMVDSGRLLRRKLIIDEMGIEGLRFGTARSYSGAVKKRTADRPKVSEKPAKTFDLPAFDMPNPKEVLEKEDLETIRLANELKADIETAKAQWETRLQELPDQQTFEDYKTRIRKVKSGARGLTGLLGTAGEAAALSKEIKADLDRIKAAKAALETDRASFEKRARQVAQAPAKDLKHLVEKYGLSSGGVANISRLLFGEKIYAWVTTAQKWYQRVQPYVAKVTASSGDKKEKPAPPERGKGVDIRFREANPLPDFLVRKIHAQAVLDMGDIGGAIENLTLEQHILGAPTTFAFTGKDLKQAASVAAKGAINFVSPQKPVHTVDLSVDRYAFSNAVLVDDPSFPLALKSGLADLSVRGRLDNSGINASGTLNTKKASLSLDMGKDAGPVKTAIASALADIRAFDVRASAIGPLEEMDIKVSSSIDEAIKTALANQLKAETDRFETALKTTMEEKIQAAVGTPDQYPAALDGIEKELAGRLNLGESLLTDLGKR